MLADEIIQLLSIENHDHMLIYSIRGSRSIA